MSATPAGRLNALVACLPAAEQWSAQLRAVCPDWADRESLAMEAVKGRCARIATSDQRPPLGDLQDLVAEIAVLLTEEPGA